MATFERPRTSVEGRHRNDLHTEAGDELLRYLDGFALLQLMEMSERGEDDLRKVIESTTATWR